MKVLFINDSTSNPNWGDRAAAIALKRMITEAGGDIIGIITEENLATSHFTSQEYEPQTVLQRNSLKERLKLFIPPILLLLKQKLESLSTSSNEIIIPARWDDFEKCAHNALQSSNVQNNLLRIIQQCDTVVIHGDGCMTGNGIIPRTLLFLSYLAKKHFDKPVIITNHTADFSDPDIALIAHKIYPLYNDVVFRDTVSVEKCKSFCNGRYAADSAFLFQPASLESWLPMAQRPTYFDVWPDTASFNPAEPYLCIGGSSLYPYIKNFEALHGFRQLIQHIQSTYPGQIILTVSDGRDQPIFRPLARQFNLPLIGLSTPVQQTVDILGNAQAYIGGRWHPSIFALRGGTPIIPISSITFKMQALAEMAGLSSSTFDALRLVENTESIMSLLNSYLDQGEELRCRLRLWAAHQSELSRENISYLNTISIPSNNNN